MYQRKGMLLNDMIKIMEKCEENNVRLIVDESFIDFAKRDLRYTLVNNDIVKKYKKLVVIKSIGKSYGVPGLRLGIMATSDKTLISFMRSNMAIWNINSFAEYYLQIQRLYKNSYKIACDKIVLQREHMIEELSNIKNLKVYSSQANYVMVKLDENCAYSSKELAIKLIKGYGLLVKNLSEKSGFNRESFLRFAVKDSEDNQKLIEALKEILG